jgi:hypothetical protein
MKKSLWKNVGLSAIFALSMPLIKAAEHPTEHPNTDAEHPKTAAEEAMAIAAGGTVVMINEDGYPVREDMVLVSMEATVEAIDYELRDVTLKGPGGNTFTVTADPQVDRLSEIAIGDTVSVSYLKSVAFELREPTIEELEEPLVILDETARAPEDMAPGAGEITVIRAVCSIEGLDRQTMTAKLLGPLGGYNIVSVADPENLTKLRIGDSVIVTYTEALAIMLEKAEVDDDEEDDDGEEEKEG